MDNRLGWEAESAMLIADTTASLDVAWAFFAPGTPGVKGRCQAALDRALARGNCVLYREDV